MGSQAEIERTMLSLLEGPRHDIGDVETWRSVLVQLTDLFDAKGAQVAYFDLSAPDALVFTVTHGFRFGARERQDYLTHGRTDPRLRVATGSPGRALSCGLDVDRGQLRDSAIYKHVMQPLGLEYTMWAHLPEDDDTLNVFGVMRGPDARPFDRAECDVFDALIPIFKRVVAVHRPQVVRALGQY